MLVVGLVLPPAAAQADSANSAGAVLTVGVHYVAPPFVGGAKVRTPEQIETLLAGELARELNRQPKYVELDAATVSLAPGSVDFAVVDLGGNTPRLADGSATIIATGQVTRSMAIMRTDTDIKSWRQLKGRTVCVSEDGRYAGRIADQYGAIERLYRAPADSLLALRTGECDAAVHDDTMLKALLRFPEWKKFSASLTMRETQTQYFVVPAANQALAETLKEVVARWDRQGYLEKLIAEMTRDIAFEVYLDQTVPDCH